MWLWDLRATNSAIEAVINVILYLQNEYLVAILVGASFKFVQACFKFLFLISSNSDTCKA